MNYFFSKYEGDYKIVSVRGRKYIFCDKPNEKTESLSLTTPMKTRRFMNDVVKLDLDSEFEILGFCQKYGLLLNTQNNPEHPTYLGNPIPLKMNGMISAFTTGCSMSLDLFKYPIQIIHNIVRLSTEIDLCKQRRSKALCSNEEKKLYQQNILDIVKLFLSLLYQPYAATHTVTEDNIIVYDGNTPLSRFAYNYHEMLHMFLLPCPLGYIPQYNRSLLNLCKCNESCHNDFTHSNTKEAIKTENDIPDFHPKNLLAIYHLIDKYSYDNIILSDNFYDNSSNERQSYINKARIVLKERFNSSKTYAYELGFYYPFTNASDTLSYKEILELLVKMEDYFSIFNHNDANPTDFDVSFKDGITADSTVDIMSKIRKFSYDLIVETINSFTTNINYKVDVYEDNFKTEYQSSIAAGSLLQAIFLQLGEFLSKYQVTICQYHLCSNMVLSLKNKPAKCCNKIHLNNYRRYMNNHK